MYEKICSPRVVELKQAASEDGKSNLAENLQSIDGDGNEIRKVKTSMT